MSSGAGRWRAIGLVLLASVSAFGKSGQLVDSGSFGIFRDGKRVATETFSIQQQPGGSVANFQLKMDDGSKQPAQTSDMELGGSGELRRYEWHQASPDKAEAVVTPSDPFLIEHLVSGPDAKPVQQPFLVPASTVILDNNFFVHREVLLWRYLAADCHPESGNLQCQKGPVEFGVLVPQDRSSLRVRLELVGKEKVNIRGAERDLLRLNLSGEGFTWALWVDDHDQFKLMRVAIPADNTEVVRD